MRQRRGILSVTLVALTAAAVASTALAGSLHKSTITVQGFAPIDVQFYEAYGTIASDSKRCFANRKVKLSAQTTPDGPYKPFDTAKTGSKGGWAGIGHSATPVESIKAVLVKSHYGPKNNRSTCGSDSETFTPDK
jgi:hypothetical protein